MPVVAVSFVTVSSVSANCANFVTSKLLRVGREDDVFVAHLHACRKEVASRIGEADRIDDRHGRAIHLRSNQRRASRQAHAARDDIGTPSQRSACTSINPPAAATPLRQRHPPSGRLRACAELELALLTRSAKGKIGLRLFVEDKSVSPGQAQMLLPG